MSVNAWAVILDNLKMDHVCLCLLMITSMLSVVYAYQQCTSWPDYKYCEDGYFCCDDNTQCCSEAILAVGAIIGIVIGCIVFISCVVVVTCCIVKKSHRPGHIVQPVQQSGVTVFTTGHPQGQPVYGQPMYGQPMYGQPSYGQNQSGTQQPQNGDKVGISNPAYPPPPPNY